MPEENGTRTPRHYSPQQLDQLQRGEQAGPTVEMLERPALFDEGAPRRAVRVPDPGERPGAVRLDIPLEDQDDVEELETEGPHIPVVPGA